MSTRVDAYEAINGELNYQEQMAGISHVIESISEGEAILAISKLVSDMTTTWYSDRAPHTDTRHIARKVAALCVRMCLDENGMPSRA
jgi:hypothetical protein